MVHDLGPLRGEIVAIRPIRGEAGARHPNSPLSPVDHVVSFQMSQKSGSNDKGLRIRKGLFGRGPHDSVLSKFTDWRPKAQCK